MRRGKPALIPQEKRQRKEQHAHTSMLSPHPHSGANTKRGLIRWQHRSTVNSETSVTSCPLLARKDAPWGRTGCTHTYVYTHTRARARATHGLRAAARSLRLVSVRRAVPGRRLQASPYQEAGGRSGARCRACFGWNRSRS